MRRLRRLLEQIRELNRSLRDAGAGLAWIACRGGSSELVSFRSPDWRDYALLDSGDGRKLERFGPYTLIRPESLATWRPALPREDWDAADAVFELDGQGGSRAGGRSAGRSSRPGRCGTGALYFV